ncbi:MAG: hypothetical protein WC686_01900 [Candidatus Shapirobacteria bacterium]|jgi:hypothetical protein
MKKTLWQSLVIFLLITSVTVATRQIKVQSASLLTVKDTLSSSQLSYYAILGTGNTFGGTLIKVNVANTAAPSFSTANLFVGDTIGIGSSTGSGSSSPLTTYTVQGIANTGTFSINTGLSLPNYYTGMAVIATRSAIHTVSFQPRNNLTAGVFQILIKASNRSGETQADGIPDQTGFDIGQDVVGLGSTGLGARVEAADVTCPAALTSTAGVGLTSVGSDLYHLFTCTLSAGITNVTGSTYAVTIGRALTAGSQLINPTSSTSRTTNGNADIYTFYVRHVDSSGNLVDSTQGKIAVVESVRVTATIDPSITFNIGTSNVGAGGTPCGLTLGTAAANTSPYAAAFGSVTLGAFNDLAHYLSCVTNADNGYVVTVYESTPLRNLSTGTTISDTNCDGACSTTTEAAWATDIGVTTSEFGYTLQNINVGTSIFNYGAGYRAFGQGASNAQEIMKNVNTPPAAEVAYICYRLTATTTQEAGNYENQLVYTATATF